MVEKLANEVVFIVDRRDVERRCVVIGEAELLLRDNFVDELISLAVCRSIVVLVWKRGMFPRLFSLNKASSCWCFALLSNAKLPP